jgi:dTDP-4-dehydrorhamnose reductase
MRVLVIGGDSPIGAAFVHALAQRGDTVHATTRRGDTVAGNRFYLDLAGDDVETITLPEVDIAFFCAAISGFAVCRADPTSARRVNVQGTGKLLRRLTGNGVYSVLLSSTAVFDFQKPHVPADTPVHPLTTHGQIKAEAEREFLASRKMRSILRRVRVTGWRLPGSGPRPGKVTSILPAASSFSKAACSSRMRCISSAVWIEAFASLMRWPAAGRSAADK